MGTKMARRAVTMDPNNSAEESNGFPIPAVETSEVARRATVVPCTSPAIPPPAISDNVHLRKGDMSAAVEAVAMVPATIAAGVAIRSRA